MAARLAVETGMSAGAAVAISATNLVARLFERR
jgi:hypothetical protein